MISKPAYCRVKMPPLSIAVPSSRILKDCFLSTVEYQFESIPAHGGIAAEEVKKKVKVLHEVHHLEALLMWRSTFEEVKVEKIWGPVSCFRNAPLLLGGDAKDKWTAVYTTIMTGLKTTAPRFKTTMDAFMLEFCSRNDTEKTRELLLSARKPSSMRIRDFVARVKQINRYLAFLPAPLNDRLDEDEITAVIRRSVPDWNDALVRSARTLANLQDLTSYYQDLEELETNCHGRNNNRQGNQRERDLVARRNKPPGGNRNNHHRREANYAENNERNNEATARPNNNNNNNANANNNGNTYPRRDNFRGRNNNYNGNNNNRYNNNRRYGNNNNNNNNNGRPSHGYNLRNRREENHHAESGSDDDRSVASNHSDTSRRSTATARTADTTRSSRSHRSNRDDRRHETYAVALEPEVDGVVQQQEIDYRPELVVSLVQSLATKRKKVVRALVDTGSSRTIVRGRVLPDWAIGKSSQDDPCVYTTLGGTFRTTKKTHVAFQLVQFAPNRTITHEVAILEDDSKTKKDDSRPDIIIGRDLIKVLGLSLDYSVEPPVITMDDSTVPIVPRGYWNKSKILENFPISALEQAEKSFEDRSPSMIAASYNRKPADLRTFIPSHLAANQQGSLYRLLNQYGIVFDGELGTLPGNPVELQLKDASSRPYHGRAYPVPKIHEKLIKDEVDRLCRLGVLKKVNGSEWGAPSFGIPKKNGQIRFVSDFRHLNKNLRRTPFPLPVPQEIFRTMDGFEYTVLRWTLIWVSGPFA